jgi:hypothetical protein
LQDGDRQIGFDTNLTRKTNVGAETDLTGEPLGFKRADRACIAADDLNPTRRATRIATTSVQNIDGVVFDGQNKLRASLDLERTSTVNRHNRHINKTPNTTNIQPSEMQGPAEGYASARAMASLSYKPATCQNFA